MINTKECLVIEMELIVMSILLSNVIHISGSDIRYPAWDTLIGLYNHEPFEVITRCYLYRDNGTVVMWPSGEFYGEVVLKPGSSFAATFIPGNGFANPPQDFYGHGVLEFFRSTPFGLQTTPSTAIYAWSMGSGGNWDSKAPSVEFPVARELVSKTSYMVPYTIPHYENAEHSGADAYVTGLSIQNFENFPVVCNVRYTVNQVYAQSGMSWSGNVTVPGNGGWRGHLHELLPGVMSLNSEGHVLVTCSPGARLFVSGIIATRNYLFTAGIRGE